MWQAGAAPRTTPTAKAGPVSELILLPYPGRIPVACQAPAAPWSLARVGCAGIPLWTCPTAHHPSPCGTGEVSVVLKWLMALPAILPAPQRGFVVGVGCVAGSCCGPHSHQLAESVWRLTCGDGALLPLAVWGFRCPLSCVNEVCFASTVIPLLGGQAAFKEAEGDLWMDAALMGLQLVGRSLQRNFGGITEACGQSCMGNINGLV